MSTATKAAKQFKCDVDNCGMGFETAAARGSHKRIVHKIAGTSKPAQKRRGKAKLGRPKGKHQRLHPAVTLEVAIASLEMEIQAMQTVVLKLKALAGG
jgi:hypothetical protein